MQKKVSVIISTKNEENNIGNLLISLGKQTVLPYEIIVVDNYSQDKTIKISKKYNSRVYLKGPERSVQRNYGARKARGNYLLFLDADMLLPPTIIAESLQTIHRSHAIGVIIPESVPKISWFAHIKDLEKKLYWNEDDIEAARFFSKNAFDQVLGYNENLIAGEDWDLSIKTRKLGKIAHIETPLLHLETSFIKDLKHKLYYAKHLHLYRQLHPTAYLNQIGFSRIKLLLRKTHLWIHHPFSFMGLFLVKSLEYVLYFSYQKRHKRL